MKWYNCKNHDLPHSSKISLVSIPNNLCWIKKGDFIFIISHFLNNHEKILIIEEIIKEEVNAYCFILSSEEKNLDKPILQYCEQYDIPFGSTHLLPEIEIDSYTQLINNLMALQNSELYTLNNTAILTEIILDIQLYILSSDFDLIYRQKQKRLDYLSVKEWTKIVKEKKRADSFKNNGTEYLCTPIIVRNQILMYIINEKKQLTDSWLNNFNSILPYFTMCFISEIRKNHFLNKNIDEFMLNILYGFYDDEDSLIWDSDFYNIDYYKSRYIMILKIDSRSIKEESVSKDVLSRIKSICSHYFYKDIYIFEKNQIIFIHEKDDESDESVNNKITSLLNELEQIYVLYKFRLGASRAYSTLLELKEAYKDASFSVRIGLFINGVNRNSFSYDDLLVFHFLYNQRNNPIIQRLYRNTVKRINMHDTEKNDILMKTMQILIDNDFNLKATSKKLYIHRNTLYQRMKRIENILGISLKKYEGKFLIYLGIKLNYINEMLNRK